MGLFFSVYTSSSLAEPRKKLHPSCRTGCHSHLHSVCMFCAWSWPYLYVGFFADTEAFLIKNARVKLCIQASLINRNLLLEDCNPESHSQDWSWQGNSLVNCGSQSSQSSPCVSHVPLHGGRWGMWKCPISILGSLQPWCLTIMGSAAKTTVHVSMHEIRLCTQGCVLPAWRDMLGNPGTEGEGHFQSEGLQ